MERQVPGFVPIKCQKYDDDLVVLTFDLLHPAESFEPFAVEMAARLSLDEQNEARELPYGFPMQMTRPRDWASGNDVCEGSVVLKAWYSVHLSHCSLRLWSRLLGPWNRP